MGEIKGVLQLIPLHILQIKISTQMQKNLIAVKIYSQHKFLKWEQKEQKKWAENYIHRGEISRKMFLKLTKYEVFLPLIFSDLRVLSKIR